MYYKTVPKRDVTKSSYTSYHLLYVHYYSPPWLYVILLLHFPHNWTNWASPSAYSSMFQSFLFIFNLLPEIESNFLLKMSYFWKQLCHGNTRLNFTCTFSSVAIMLEKYLKYSKFSSCFYLPCPVLGLVAFRLILHYFFYITLNYNASSNLNYCINYAL